MEGALGCIKRNWQILVKTPSQPPKSDHALKFGVLGASRIAPMVICTPAKLHPEVILYAIAARDKKKATTFAKKHGIPVVHDSYEALLDDQSIDAVYIPLPNGLHFEWALKALAKGKHVLLEKPTVSNAEEAELLFNSPLLRRGSKPPVLLEAIHYRFQPQWRLFMSFLDQPNIATASARMLAPAAYIPKDDIRFDYELAGGCISDMGAYCITVLRAIFGAEPEECIDCKVKTMPPPRELCDWTFDVRFRFPNGGVGDGHGDLQVPMREMFEWPSVRVVHRPVVERDDELAQGQQKTRTRTVVFTGFVIGAFYHKITVEDEFVVREAGGEELRRWTDTAVHKAYTYREAGVDRHSEPYWLSYRYQLEEFVDRIRGRPSLVPSVNAKESIASMHAIDMAYDKSGLPRRPTSKYRPAES